MDVAYDHVQEGNYPDDEGKRKQQPDGAVQEEKSINEEVQEAYKTFSASPWGMKLGGLWGTVRKQSEQYIATAQQEITSTSETATKAAADLANRARTLTITQDVQDAGAEKYKQEAVETNRERPESLIADIQKEASEVGTSFATRLRTEAARRLREAQKLEDQADEALLAWGTSLGAFLKDAVTIAPPSSEDVQAGKGEVLFASKDSEGKRVVHATRLDAQLHVIHCSLDSFLKDPSSREWDAWTEGFDVDSTTEEISKDLERYEQLRQAMEKLVPEQVEYKVFWCRYYFLRHVVETEETRRRELLKGATTNTEEEVAWDSDDEPEEAATPKNGQSESRPTTAKPIQPMPAAKDDSDNATLKPAEPRKSNEHSSAGSEASYDIVSGATSRAPGSPIEKKKKDGEDSDEDDDDWE